MKRQRPNPRRPQHFHALPRLTLLTALLFGFALTGCHKDQSAYSTYSPAPPPLAEAHPRAPIVRSQARAAEAPEPDEAGAQPAATEVGLASWYGPPYHNRQAADGSIFDQNALTAAHRTLPLGTMLRVTNLASGQSVVVRITDRGPFVPNRILDLSLAAAKATGIYQAGVAKVKIDVFPNAAADPAGRWCVQIGAFLDPADAIQLKNDLLRRYVTAKVIEFQGPTGYWVRINPLHPDRATASAIVDSIHIPDADPYLVRTN